MRIDVVMPKMGESLQEGTITKWLKKEGDQIERDEMILEISTDKVDTEVPAPQSGVLVKILAEENQTVEVGNKIAEIETDADSAASAPTKEETEPAGKEQEQLDPEEVKEEAKKQAAGSTSGDVVDVVMPKMGESLQEGTITKWLKKEGDRVERDEMILEISTDKVDTEVPSPVSGVLSEIIARENETIEVGNVVARISTSDGAVAKKESAPESQAKVQDIDEQVAPGAEAKPSTADISESEVSEDQGDLTEVVMPKMGESLQEGTITKWLKKKGDKVERDEMILEISTDKVDTEVPSPVSGTLVEILAEENETIEVGSPIARISASGKAPAKAVANVPAESGGPELQKDAQQRPAAQTKNLPESRESAEVTIPHRGGTTEIPRKHGGKFYSPLVREIAKDKGITLEELEQLDGSGSDGRITKDDILAYAGKRGEAPARRPEPKQEPDKAADPQEAPAQERPVSKPSPKPAAAQKTEESKKQFAPAPAGDEVEVIPMNRVRQLIAEHMVYSKHTSAHVTSVGEADVTDIVKFRNNHKQEFQGREGFKLTFTPFFAAAAVEGLKQFPLMNVSVDEKNILRHKRIHLGMATALDDGNLIVPVIKNADSLNITGIARSVYDLATRARSKKLNPDDIQGGTFTITNVGTFGTLFGTPVINQPQVGIFGIGAIKKRPIVKEVDGNDLIVVRHMAYVSITYDHRVVDGMLAGQYLAHVIKTLEGMNEKTISM
ncbi:MAG: 2-oxo acid dehydrogenase subunit E2 [Candidatus Kapaibacterium sp.]